MPLLRDHPQQPIGGHRFTDPSGVGITAATLPELLDAVAGFRKINGLPAGNPAAEVEAYYAVRFPWWVTKVGVNPAVHEDPIAKWINRQWRNPPDSRKFVESEVERVRLETCRACPHYTPSHTLDLEASRRLTILGAGRTTDSGVCTAHQWATSVAALIASPDTVLEVPGCWSGK